MILGKRGSQGGGVGGLAVLRIFLLQKSNCEVTVKVQKSKIESSGFNSMYQIDY